ncbi:hypothetical protein [Williamsia sterculiae]|uniref:Osmoprotectant transport system substrate-binding protein n=1 Tax=Williamsia sterculiae TaxID=1344003 RepID=A0A1N7E133_9NOCA|nr:hypothetical protein [Williamsia sterculiae]SIR81817.1 hypothetical protein SAMN05445060_1087 [Williamsia sterculiae]
MPPTDRNRGWVIPLVVCALLICAGCSTRPSSTDGLVLGSAPATGLRITAQIYAGVLRHAGARVADDLRTRDEAGLLDEVATGRLDLFPTFTGDALTSLTPPSSVASATASPTPSGADDGVDARYVALNESLPQGVTAGDATPVRDDAGDSLVPVYRSAVLSREQVRAVNQVAGELTTADLEAMVTSVDSGRTDTTQAASTWLGEHGL